MRDLKDGEITEIKGSGAKPYVLRNTGGVYSCSCSAWRNQSIAIETRTCKHLVWKTHKSDADPSYPAYEVHWTDYSAGRGAPLEREVRTSPSSELAEAVAAKLIEENVKKGVGGGVSVVSQSLG